MKVKAGLLFFLLLLSSRLVHAQADSAGLELIAEGLTSPLTLMEAPDGTGRLFVVDQIGQIRVIKSGNLESEPFLDISDRMVTLMPGFDERGLLGLAFHPNYSNNGRFFIIYSSPPDDETPMNFDHVLHVSEFKVSSNPDMADTSTEKILLEIDHPQFNHEGGTLAFGPSDGYLYISIGDGGGANDNQFGHVEDWYAFNAGGNGQDIDSNLLGNVLRIDVDNGDPYGIPADNPFIDKPGLDEIWAYGFRNPYRFSFDIGGDHKLYLGDAGQDLYEEVDIVVKGGNYGWNVKEGTHCFDAANPSDPPADCPDVAPNGDTLIDPVIEFKNSNAPGGGVGVVVVGGHVYRGALLTQICGRYVFGTWTIEGGQPEGLIFLSKPTTSGLWSFDTLLIANSSENELNHFLLGFGQDKKGEVYVMVTDSSGPTGNSGKVYKLTTPFESSGVTAVNDKSNLPTSLALHQNYPNPFNPSTTIEYSLPAEAHVTLKVYDVLGKVVTELVNDNKPAGNYEVKFDASNITSGLYFYQLESGNKKLTGKMTLLK